MAGAHADSGEWWRGCRVEARAHAPETKSPAKAGQSFFMRSFRRLVRSMVFMICLPPLTAELEVTTIDVAVALVALLTTILGGEGWRSGHGRKSDGDDKKRFHESLSRCALGQRDCIPKASAARYEAGLL